MSQLKDPDNWKTDEWLCLCIDLQQTHMLPQSNWNANFYKRKCPMYNFCIVNLQDKEEPYFYLWEEFNGAKGSAEIYTAIDMYLREYVYCNPGRTQKKVKDRRWQLWWAKQESTLAYGIVEDGPLRIIF